MEFERPLIEGTFLKRYKRFFADVELDGEIVTAHVPNTGSLKSCNTPGSRCLLSTSDDPNRALKFTLQAVESDNHWVGVNTSWPNKLAIEIFQQGVLTHWKEFDRFQAEVKINSQSRIDLMLWHSGDSAKTKWKAEDFENFQPVHFVEIKNVTLKVGRGAYFPDAVTERGQKHIQELCDLIDKGFSAEMLFVVQRTDVDYFAPAKDIDPTYAQLLKRATEKGLKVTALSFAVTKNGFALGRALPLKMEAL